MPFFAKHHRLLGGGTALLAVSVMLIVSHINTIAEVKEFSVPLVGQLPELERKLDVLKQQVELTELHAVTRPGSMQEKVEVFALPKETDVSRIIATFEVVRDVLERNGYLADMSSVDISEEREGPDGIRSRDVSVEFVVHDEGLKTILLLVEIGGLLTIGDVLTEEETALLLHRIEQENPSGLIPFEQFLSADLLRYIEDSKTYEEQLRRSFSSTTFLNAFENVLRTSLLYDSKVLLRGGIGEALSTYKLWPLQIMAVKEVSIQPGSAEKWNRLGLTVEVFSADS